MSSNASVCETHQRCVAKHSWSVKEIDYVTNVCKSKTTIKGKQKNKAVFFPLSR